MGQVGEDDSEGSKEPWHVFHDDVSGSKYANGSGELKPELGPLSLEHESFPGDGEVGAGEPADEDVDRREARVDFADIGDDGDAGRGSFDDPSAGFVALAGPGGAIARSLEAEIQPADAGEERAHGPTHAATLVT